MKNCSVCNYNSGDGFSNFYLGSLKIIRCTNCGFIFHDEDTENILEEDINKRFIESNRTFFHPERTNSYIDTIRQLKKYPLTGNDLLDVGCRDAHFLTICKENGFNCFGVEPSIRMHGYLIKKGFTVKNDFYKENMYEKESFDVLSFIQVLEHIPDPLNNALKYSYTHLKKGGYIIIEVPSIQNPSVLLYRLTGIKKLVKNYFIKDHCNYFSPKTLEKLMKAAGFRKVEIVTGRLGKKYTGLKAKIGFLFDGIFNALRVGGILYIGKKD